MFSTRCPVAATLLVLAASAPVSAGPTDQEVLESVTRSLDFIRDGGVEWIEQRECVSCHQIPFMVWSLNRAAEHGLPVESDRLGEWNDWAVDWRNFAAPKNREGLDAEGQLTGNVDILYQLLLAQPANEPQTEWPEEFVSVLTAAQGQDGSWKAGGQLPFQKRDKEETHAATTMWVLYALSSRLPDEVWQPLHAAAEPVIDGVSKPISTEWWAARALLADASGETETVARARDQLLSHQQSDGGWGWRLDEQSDAMGTGLALYSLARTGSAGDPAIAQGREFLVGTQQEDGSWAVPGTKAAKRDRIEETSTYWGTCWAIIGLLESVNRE